MLFITGASCNELINYANTLGAKKQKIDEIQTTLQHGNKIMQI
jgi:hypothetical protein